MDLYDEIRSIQQKEINKGLKFYEKSINDSTLIGQVVGGLPGNLVSMGMTHFKYSKQSSDTMAERKQANLRYREDIRSLKKSTPNNDQRIREVS